jgi:hypothetical protein
VRSLLDEIQLAGEAVLPVNPVGSTVNPVGRGIRQVDRVQQRHKASAFVFGVVKKYGDDNGGTLAASLGLIWGTPLPDR